MTAVADKIAKAAAAKAAAANPTPPPAGEAPKKPGRPPAAPKLDADGKEIPRAPRVVKSKEDRLAELKVLLDTFETRKAAELVDLQTKITQLEAGTTKKIASKDEVLAQAKTFGATPDQIKANIKAQIAKLQSMQKGMADVSDEDLAAALVETPDSDDEGEGVDPEQEVDTDGNPVYRDEAGQRTDEHGTPINEDGTPINEDGTDIEA